MHMYLLAMHYDSVTPHKLMAHAKVAPMQCKMLIVITDSVYMWLPIQLTQVSMVTIAMISCMRALTKQNLQIFVDYSCN